MGQIEKLKEKILKIPSDLTYEEIKRFLMSLGYEEQNKGKTSGSRVAFYRERDKAIILLHKPHPGNIIPKYALRQIVEKLKIEGEL